jgi:hypothetical protein
MATLTIHKEKNVLQEMANHSERIVEGHFARNKSDGTIALAFVPREGGHSAYFRLNKAQAEKLRAWLNRTAE